MSSQFQGTVSRIIKFSGVGLHTGRLVKIEIHPAPPHSGVRFLRTDEPKASFVMASVESISQTTLCTTLGHGSSQIATVEHLLAAFAGLGIDNAMVYINACEIPILDGSSAPFVDKLDEAGVQVQHAKRAVLHVDSEVHITRDDQFVHFVPGGHELEIQCSIDFPMSRAIGKQTMSFVFGREAFMKICEARTFCHINDVNSMRAQGLAKGGSLDNAVVVNDEAVVNADGLRFKDEFVRHKILDCLGDLFLLRAQLYGKLKIHKGGHSLHAEFTKHLLALTASQLSSKEARLSAANEF